MDARFQLPGSHLVGCACWSIGVGATDRCQHQTMFRERCPGSISSLRFPTANGPCPRAITGTPVTVRCRKINTGNVKNLHIVGMMSTGIPHGHEGQPLVVDNTLYMVTPFPNNLIALDLTKPGLSDEMDLSSQSRSELHWNCLLRCRESRRQLCRRKDHLQHSR